MVLMAMIPEPEKIRKSRENYTEAGGFDLAAKLREATGLSSIHKITHKFGEVMLLGNQGCYLNPKE